MKTSNKILLTISSVIVTFLGFNLLNTYAATIWTGAVDGALGNDANYDSPVGIEDNVTFATSNLTGAAASPSSGVWPGGTVINTDLTISGGTIANMFNSGTISGGSITSLFDNNGTISGGSITSLTDNNGTISGGSIAGLTNNNGTISGGTIGSLTDNNGGLITGTAIISGDINNNGGVISGGTFNGAVDNIGGVISGGTFNGTLNLVNVGDVVATNNGTIITNAGTVTANHLTITTNDGTVTLNTAEGLSYVVTNNGTVTTNNGTVTTNNGTVTNGEYGYITTNSSTGIVDINNNDVIDNSGTVTINAAGGTITTNNLTVTTNNGTIDTNSGTVETNNLTVTTNNGTVTLNNTGGSAFVWTNNGTVTTNEGDVPTNNGTVVTNNKWVTNNESSGTVTTNNYLVYTNNGTITSNLGDVTTNNTTLDQVASGKTCDTNNGTVTTNNGTISTNNGTVVDNTAGGIITANSATGIISGGTFYFFVTNEGTINDGSFCQTQLETGGTINGGTFSIIHASCYNYVAPAVIITPSNLSVVSSWVPSVTFTGATVCKYKFDSDSYVTIDCSTPVIPAPSQWPHILTLKADDFISPATSFIYSTLLNLFTGTLTPSASPVATNHTLSNLCAVADSNTPSTAGDHAFTTALSPANSMCSVTELYIKLANLIHADKIKSGVTYLGVLGGGSTPEHLAEIASSLQPTVSTSTATGFSLNDVYHLIKNNTRVTSSSHTLTPSNPPTSTTTHSIEDIYREMTGLIQPGNVYVGTTYLGAVGTYVAP